MCGIAGLCYRDDMVQEPVALKGMLDTMGHRGPDDRGIYVYRNVALGHNRLSILDLTEAGHQPMHCGHLSVTYNGEIYNYVEIREELRSQGHVFATDTDTEVLLQAYDRWGEECLQRMTGMWAFAILDRKRNQLFCSRDRFGIKPFYYYCDEEIFLAFASEIKALIHSVAKPQVHYERLMDYLVIGLSDHTEETLYQSIKQLLPGHSLFVDLGKGTKKTKRYYFLGASLSGVSTEEDFEVSLRKSVSIHMRSDVPVGTCLSGGIDSSVVAALAASVNRSLGKETFSAITAQSESSSNDETPFAHEVAKHCDLDWHVTKPDYRIFKENLEDCLWHQEEPVGGPSVFMQYWVMKKAKEVGLKVMLDGQGGDEIMFGYERYYAAFFWHLMRHGRALRCLQEFSLAASRSKLHLGQLAALTVYFLFPALRRRVLEKRGFFLNRDFLQLTRKSLREAAKAFFDIGELQISEIGRQQLPHLLKYEDRNSMAHSIEARVPYVEIGCVETSLRVPPGKRIRAGYTKYPLRRLAEKILPPSIAWRKNKIGFEAPSALWLGQQKPLMAKEIEHSGILRRVCQSIPPLEALGLEMQWRLYNIAVWERLFDVKP
ncbi:MAG: asparagine synthase (glutamine-hydrolyzing) [Thermodesulfobacteriota bacterium]